MAGTQVRGAHQGQTAVALLDCAEAGERDQERLTQHAFLRKKARARHRSHSIDFKRQVVADHAGETIHALRIWVEKAEAGSLDQDMASAELLSEYEARIAAVEWWSAP